MTKKGLLWVIQQQPQNLSGGVSLLLNITSQLMAAVKIWPNCCQNSKMETGRQIRSKRHDKKMSMKKKKRKREDKFWEKDDQMLNMHISYSPDATKSPHIHINKSFHRIQDNCIILYSPIEKGNGTGRKMYYERVEFGTKVQYTAKKKYINLHPENTANNRIVILVPFKEVLDNQGLSFFTEIGNSIKKENLHLNNEGYVILGTIQANKMFRQTLVSFSIYELNLTKFFCYNQTNKNRNNHHFGTTGAIHSFGYGPMYNLNPETKHSIDKFANRKFFIFYYYFFWY